jgi:hypothetical protein
MLTRAARQASTALREIVIERKMNEMSACLSMLNLLFVWENKRCQNEKVKPDG